MGVEYMPHTEFRCFYCGAGGWPSRLPWGLMVANADLQVRLADAREALVTIFHEANDPTGLADPPLDDISELARAALEGKEG